MRYPIGLDFGQRVSEPKRDVVALQIACKQTRENERSVTESAADMRSSGMNRYTVVLIFLGLVRGVRICWRTANNGKEQRQLQNTVHVVARLGAGAGPTDSSSRDVSHALPFSLKRSSVLNM
jgi:hypothetical protein